MFYYVGMKSCFLYLLVLFALVLPSAVFASEESIPSFDARIVVHKNATIEVTERILYDFGDNERHGIFRIVPYSYQAGDETYTADVTSVLVTDGAGTPLPFNESRGNGELTLKIGDPDVTITGEHTYVLTYIVKGPFLYYEDFDELYWNVTGYWKKPMDSASVLVDLPVGAEVVRASCYKGRDGSQESCDSDERLINAERAGYNAQALHLASEEGFTIGVAFPKGVIVEEERPWETKESLSVLSFLPFSVPFFVFIFMYYLWYTKGRDPKGRSSIVTEFGPPPGLVPSVASALYTERVRPDDVSAEIVRLAVEGYIVIHRFEKKVLIFKNGDYLLERVGEDVPKDAVGQLLLAKLFQDEFIETETIGDKEVTGTVLSNMAHTFVDEKKDIADRVYGELEAKQFFSRRPDKARNAYLGGGVGLVVLGIILLVIFAENGAFGAFLGIATALSGVIVMVFGNWMPVKTAEGVRVREHLEGFKRYLDVAEKERIAFHDSPEKEGDAPEKTFSIFNKYLPYAMVFGVEEKWGEQFEDMFTEEPDWYRGATGESFSVGGLTSSLHGFSQDMSSAMAPKSSGSGGGGSVGGGFGGGGGGSW